MDKSLAIYLNDQFALGVLWRELARRAARNNRGGDFDAALDRVSTAIAEDVETFHGIMKRLGIGTDPVKPRLAKGAEYLGRFKPNGRLFGYSPLSRFVEIEILVMGIEGKKQLWTTLRDLAGLGQRLPGVDFDELIRRAEDQRAELEPLRTRAGIDAFAQPG